MTWVRNVSEWKKSLFGRKADKRDVTTLRGKQRPVAIETMEPRQMFDADPIWLGGVYVEEDGGSDQHGDSIHISFRGGAEGTQLKRLVINTDQNLPGMGVADNFFDLNDSGLGADHGFPFRIEQLVTANPNARVTAAVQDGSMQLVLTFENFMAGDLLVFSIDVDEVQHFDASELDLNVVNGGIDPITSGVEFQGSKITGEFFAPHYEDVSGTGTYLNVYDQKLSASNLNLPTDNAFGKRDRSAGTAFQLQQIAKPISLSGTVYVDNNLNLIQDGGEAPIAGVSLELFRKEANNYVSTGHRTTTDAAGNYQFPVSLRLMPGTYQVRETQPNGYYSVGAIPGKINGQGAVGQIVTGDRDVLTEITILKGDTHAIDLDFAEAQPARISGFVYRDNNDDGRRDPGEQGIAGVTMRLEPIDTISPQIALTVLTGIDGSYQFTGLAPGKYRVIEVNQPADLFDGKDTVGTVAGVGRGQSPQNDTLVDIQLNGNDVGLEYNFGELPPSSISGHVCLVNPGYDCGSTDPSAKRPLSGVKVDLLDSAGRVVATTTTAADGTYRFDRLVSGIYTIVEYTPSNYLDGKSTVGKIRGLSNGSVENPSRIGQINLSAGNEGVDYDFCEIMPASISGHVYDDLNDDGTRQNNEPLLAGAAIRLLDENGMEVARTTTDSQGFYRFEFLRPGTYVLEETTPSGFLDGKDRAGTIDGRTIGNAANDGDRISQIVLASGKNAIDYDFGELREGEIQGRVIVDTDGDCEVDAPGDMPLANVVVELLDNSGNVLRETRTDADGNYRFTGLRPGSYAVRERQPVGYFQGGQRAGTGGGDASTDDLIRSINLRSGDRLEKYDFCEIPPSEIAGRVIIDSNGDCEIQPNERGLSGVRVDLLDADGNILETTLTRADGTYGFRNLAPGIYAVREYQPVGYYHGGQKAGSHGGHDLTPDLISAISIAAGQSLSEYNFCEVEPAELSGIVYADTDQDCVRDDNEAPLAQVRIELLDGQGRVVETTMTGADGRYRFMGLRPGSYSIREVQPEGIFHGGQTAPNGRADASTDDLLTMIQLGSGERLTDLDFCEVPPAMISGYVFQDGTTILTEDGLPPDRLRTVRDGMRTQDDTPLANVTLELRNILGQPFPSNRALPGYYGGPFIQVQTDANGYFQFSGLRSGTYHVYQMQPQGYIDSLDTPGTLGGLSVNREDIVSSQDQQFIETLASDQSSNPRGDAILLIDLAAGQHAMENNFSEVRVAKLPLAPPPPVVPPTFQPPRNYPPVGPPFERVLPAPPIAQIDSPIPLGGGVAEEYTWHLSVINAGNPRGVRADRTVSKDRIAKATAVLDVTHWTVAGLNDGKWTIVSTARKIRPLDSRSVFNVAGAKPLAGDFNGDGISELALYVDGEWLLDVNGNGRWDRDDIWAKLGKREDLPVVGDWDGDGKDDIGIFGPEWEGDAEAIQREPGLPDPQNEFATEPKNVPPTNERTAVQERLMQRKATGNGRADVIDHVFRFGAKKDQAISGDFNGDGISTVGLFRDGKWRLDVDGDGKWSNDDVMFEFGQAGDVAVVGDFNGDGIDEIAVVRGNQVIIDSNGNGRWDASDRVFELEDAEGEVVVGDFDGDGLDEPALHRSSTALERLQASESEPIRR